MAKFEQINTPAVSGGDDFNLKSGNFLERLIFNNRVIIVLVSAVLTLLLGFEASKLEINTSFDKMLPKSHEFVINYLDNKESLRSQGNSVQINIHNTEGNIYDPEYLAVLQEISDAVFLLPGVDRAFMKSLWTPTVRWTEVTEEGFRGGAVMPADYDGSAESIDRLRANISRAGIVGSLVSDDQTSSLINIPLLDRDPSTGEPLDFKKFSDSLESIARAKSSERIDVHIVGFAKLIGDLIDGMQQVMSYFGIAALLTVLAIFAYTRCVRSTLLVIGCSLIAVIWQLGIVHLAGFSLDPYSILVPFLIFAIGVSHGAQKLNGIMQDIGRGTHRYVAARYTFRRLFMAGLISLLSDLVGFAVLMVIDIPVIRDIALTASIGVGLLVLTNLILLPVLLSYFGVSQRVAARSHAAGSGLGKMGWFDRFTQGKPATYAVVIGALFAAAAYIVSLDIKIGDLDKGAPELRADSRYNRDVQFMNENYGLSSDQFVVIVKTAPYGISKYETLIEQDRLQVELSKLDSVQAVYSPASYARFITAGGYENSPKWLTINRDNTVNSSVMNHVYTNYPEVINTDWSVGLVTGYLADHKAETLSEVVRVVEAFAQEHNTADRQFLLAAGTAGMQAATNMAVEHSNRLILFLVYGAICLLCLIAFRSWRAVLVALLPLFLTSLLSEALMVALGIGIKVATLPVIALGVGIGVDYALYLLSIQLTQQSAGASLKDAYRRTLASTGKVVALVGVTLAVGVVTWAWSPIKFQADMGILLTFMFLANMIGALIGVPALSYFLLSDKYFNALRGPNVAVDEADSSALPVLARK